MRLPRLPLKRTTAFFDIGEAKLGFGLPESAFGVEAPLPMPRRANASHKTLRSLPSKRILSAAIMASRASSIDVAPCWSRNESKISWIQRRLPGQDEACRGPLA